MSSDQDLMRASVCLSVCVWRGRWGEVGGGGVYVCVAVSCTREGGQVGLWVGGSGEEVCVCGGGRGGDCRG